jgi:hypothetical protein
MPTQSRTWQRNYLAKFQHNDHAGICWYVEAVWAGGQRQAPAVQPAPWVPVVPVGPNPEGSRRIAGLLAEFFRLSAATPAITFVPALASEAILTQSGCQWYEWDKDVVLDAVCGRCGAVGRVGHTELENMLIWYCGECAK